MAETRFDVLTIGNAIVDVIAPIDPGFLEREGMSEGIMHLVDAERSAYLYDRMPAEKRQISGGSSANTAAGVASLGGRASFVGKVAADVLGDVGKVIFARHAHFGPVVQDHFDAGFSSFADCRGQRRPSVCKYDDHVNALRDIGPQI